MKLQPRRRQQPDINLTALIDVVFLLLIFFMVSTTFRKEADFKINLPEASREPSTVEQYRLEVLIDATGRYSINGQLLAGDGLLTLKQAMSQAAKKGDDLPVVIRADAQTPHQAVVRVMDAAGQLGLKRLGIVSNYSAEDDRSITGQ